jgi:mannose-1-phosphate guanylyltransferase
LLGPTKDSQGKPLAVEREEDMMPRQSAVEESPAVFTAASKVGSDDPLCGIVLAGGEGKRLRSFIHLLRKDLLPKQYVNFIGRRSMLEHTFHRAQKIIDSKRLFTVLNKTHLRFPEVEEQIRSRPPETIVVQPENRETGPGLLLPLMHVAKYHPNSVVAVFPSDHFVLEEATLMKYVHRSHLIVKKDPSRLVLLGIEPEREESQYGYIVPAKASKRPTKAFPVSCFLEKPASESIPDLIHRGALWNTMIMVFRPDALLEVVRKVIPHIHLLFRRIYDAIGTARQEKVVEEIYAQLRPVNLSKEILEPFVQAHPSKVLAMPVRGVLWSDWGTETRVLEVLRQTGSMSRLNGLSLAAPDPLATWIMSGHREPTERPLHHKSSISVGPKRRKRSARIASFAGGSALG